ncbi:MAG: hypothetical protein QFX34_04760 [Candidatus Verstraetearchaeota archaeon]|nr:hypothetical protein [Candidatus Verstraetearchaeota archaeon]
MGLPRLLGLLALFSAIALTAFLSSLFVLQVYPLTGEGGFTYTRVSGDPVSSITVCLPLSEDGENVFKVPRMSASSAKGEWACEPGASGLDMYPDCWVLSGPPLEPGESLDVRFTMEHVRDIRYEGYPWTVRSDVETKAPVAVYRSYLVTIVAWLEANSQAIATVLGALALTLALAAVVGWAFSRRVPEAYLTGGGEGIAFREGPGAEEGLLGAMGEGERRCERWRYVCLKFFVVDECGGSKKPSEKKAGLLKGSKYREKGAFGDLSEEAARSILRLIEGASRVWAQCCIRLVPCIDEEGKSILKALDPERAPYEEPVEGTVTVPVERKDGGKAYVEAEASYATDLCQFLTSREEGRPRRDLKTKDGRMKGERTLAKFVWKEIDAGQLEGTVLGGHRGEFKEGRRVKGTLEEIIKKAKDVKEREAAEAALEEARKRLPEREGREEVDLLDLFSKAVDSYFARKCVNVFVFGDFEDEAAQGDEAGIAELGGRVIFLDESVVLNRSCGTLAHEVGHVLGLGHRAEDRENLMHPVCGGSKLDEAQCEAANGRLKEKGLCDEKSVRSYLEKALRMAEEFQKRAEELHKKYADEKARRKRIEECERQAKKLEGEAEGLRKKAEKAKRSERLEREIEGKLEKARQLREEMRMLEEVERILRRSEEDVKRIKKELERVGKP